MHTGDLDNSTLGLLTHGMHNVSSLNETGKEVSSLISSLLDLTENILVSGLFMGLIIMYFVLTAFHWAFILHYHLERCVGNRSFVFQATSQEINKFPSYEYITTSRLFAI